MPFTRTRVPIPRKAEELLRLAQLIQERHSQLGNDSPLLILNPSAKAAAIDAALNAQREAEALRRQMEIAYEQRDLKLKEVNVWVRQCRDVLAGLHREEMRRLGEYGFNVDTSARSNNTSNNPES